MSKITIEQILAELEIFDYPEVVTNPFSGRSCELEPEAVALYDFIKGCEIFEQWEAMRVALDYFMTKWPGEYMTLLD